MELIGQSLFWISTAGFLASILSGFVFWARLYAVRTQAKGLRVWNITLWGKLSSQDPAERYARNFMRCILVAAIFWCIAAATGITSGVLH